MTTITLEQLLTRPAGFGLVSASPLQRAICRIADGLPLAELAAAPSVRAAIGNVDAVPASLPAELGVLSGIRTGKSLLAAALAVRASQTCDLSKLGPGEIPRVSVLSLTTDLGRVIFDHVVGNVMAKPALKALVIGEPTTDSVTLRHPSNRPVEIKVVAGSRAGASLVARWSAGCIFDEAPRMVGADDAVVNFDDARRAVLGRLLPGAQLVWIGSPWAPFGPIYDLTLEHWGKPSERLVIVRAPAPAMNPVYWTAERVEKLRQQDPTTHRTDVLAEFADPESALLSSMEIEAATRSGPLVLRRAAGHTYTAAMDPGTRGNAWTLAIATRDARGKRIVALTRQWIGSKTDPLSPDFVLQEIANVCRPYGVETVITDQWSSDALRAIAERYELYLRVETITAARKVEIYENLRARLANGEVELPPDPQVRADLLSLRKQVTQNGIAIVLPRGSDGRHADYAPAVALAIAEPVAEPEALPPNPGSREYEDAFAERLFQQRAEEIERELSREWWEA